MWLFILLICLIFFLGIAIFLCNGDMMEPLALSFEAFILSVLIAFCYNGFTKSDISLDTVILIVMGLFIYMVGYLIVKVFFQYKVGEVVKYSKSERRFCFPNKKLSFILFIIELVAVSRTFIATLSIARRISSSANILNMLEYARNAYLFTDESMGLLTSILSFYVTAISYFYTYALIVRIVEMDKIRVKSFFKYKLEIVMVTMSLFSGMMGTGRTFLIKYIVFLFSCFYYLRFAKDKVKRVSVSRMMNTIKKMVITVIVFFILFQLMGILTNKTGKMSAIDMFYQYSGASIIALDRSIDNYAYDGRFFGEESFYGLYGFLNSLGFDVPNNILHLPFVDIGGGARTNIYTSIRTYLYDFGYVGMYIVQFLLGMISAIMYVMMYRTKRHPIFMLIYGILLYGTVMQGIEEITLRNFMSITNVFITIFFVFFYIITQWKIRIK